MNLSIKKLVTPAIVILLLASFPAGCGSNSSTKNTTNTVLNSNSTTTQISTTTNQQDALTGAGATFPQPLYSKWFDVYNQLYGIKINYQGIGSGAGIQQITLGSVDFGASDAILSSDQESAAVAAFGPILQIPMTSGSVAIIYNLGGITSGQIKLNGEVLVNIYLKKILKWNDPAITALNPGLNLPDQSIVVVHRSDGSGTTFIFTNYLSKISSEWYSKIGNATSVAWPGDIGGALSAGVAGQVEQMPGAIGYVELSYALQNNLPLIALQNSSGKFMIPSIASTNKAAEGITMPDDMKIMITNSPNPDAYPIVGFTWILAYANQTNQPKGLILAKMLWWAIHDGQQYCAPLDYGALSPDAVVKAENEILSMNYQGKPLITR
jgi:phosphate transport system substrate-binding protein